jgi:hypothetical protein
MKFVWYKSDKEKIKVNVQTFNGNKVLISYDNKDMKCNKAIAELYNCEILFYNNGMSIGGFEQCSAGENIHMYQIFELNKI